MKIVIGSRGSQLALIQSEQVKKALLQVDPTMQVVIKVIKTKGDIILDQPLNQIGNKGVFTKEIEQQLIDQKIDLAVHSLKDMPVALPEPLMITKTIIGVDQRDCLVFNPTKNYRDLASLPVNAKIGTGSIRRKSQLIKLRPDLKFVNIRGNIQTRLKKLESENFDALILAVAGLKRLNLEHLIGYYFDYDQMIPACNQGILGIEIRKDSPLLPLIEQISDEKTTLKMELSRLYQKEIGGDCHQPIGCVAIIENKKIIFYALHGNNEGSNIYQTKIEFEDNYQQQIINLANEMKGKVAHDK